MLRLLKKISLQHPLYYMPLIFMAFPFLGPFYLDYPVWTLLPSFLFLLAYLYLVHSKENRVTNLLWSYMLGYVAYMTLFVNGGMMWFFFYLISLLVYRFEDRKKSYRYLSFLFANLLIAIAGLVWGSDIGSRLMSLLLPCVNFSLLTFLTREREREKQEKLITQQHKTINLLAAENERNRIGRDLHDSLGHTFAMMTLKTELALKLLEKEEVDSVRKELLELNQISRQSMQEVRQIISNLKFRRFDEELLSLEEMFTSSAITLKIDNQLASQVLSPMLESSLIMIVRELTNNVIKHSQAQKASLKIWRDQGLCIRMEDDGLGFSEWTGQELHTIRDRLEMIGGSIELTSPKNPTILLVRLSEK